MGNKTGKFNVPATEKTNKDEQVINEEGVVDVPVVEANGDQPKQESNGIEKTETNPEVKKKSIVSWFKKVSMRKEKKSKTPKENGVKDEVVEAPKENGVVEEPNETIKENGNCEVVSDKEETVETPEVHNEEKEVSPEVTEIKEESPILNGHDTGVESSEPKEEEEQ